MISQLCDFNILVFSITDCIGIRDSHDCFRNIRCYNSDKGCLKDNNKASEEETKLND